jgi:mono/diheme cytochrome c family protein
MSFNFLFFALLILLVGCQPSLEHQPKTKPLSEAPVSVPGTVAFNKESELPPVLNEALLLHGQQSYDIYCSVCHGLAGHGEGMATLRGYPHAPDFSQAQLSNQQLYKIISEGLPPMPGFRRVLRPQDRWAIVHYVRVLQLRERWPVEFLEAKDQQKLQAGSR